MPPKLSWLQNYSRGGALLKLNLGLVVLANAAAVLAATHAAPSKQTGAVRWDQIGAKAGADYKGDGLEVATGANGARLHCVFQRLDGEATREGLWLTSTVTQQANDRFRLKAARVERESEAGRPLPAVDGASVPGSRQRDTRPATLPGSGDISVDGQTVRFVRPGLIEEYSVSMDGVRQDFVVLEKPGRASIQASRPGGSLTAPMDGQLRVELEVTGAKVEPNASGTRLVLEDSGRKIAYSRLRVTDAMGKELPARMEVTSGTLAVLVNDTDAVYPVRIDPTFSDANWISMGGIPGANNVVRAAVVDDSGHLYIGGDFTAVGDVIANGIAKWNGSSWSALGSGLGGGAGVGTILGDGELGVMVNALAVSGSELYVGGNFTRAGGIAANGIAKWNGSSWSALGSGVRGPLMGEFGFVSALAVSGSDLYAGGLFTSAGGIAANYIAKWNGSSWSALGSGMDGSVSALAVSGSDLYAGGGFSSAGGIRVRSIAKWNGSNWSALGSGFLNGGVAALAVSGSDLYVGGTFTTAGEIVAHHIAKWNGSSWSALGSGLILAQFPSVSALAVLGSDLYAGGNFTTAGGIAANNIAKWNGSSWSALGSGAGDQFSSVNALAASGNDLYAGGVFRIAGGIAAHHIAKWSGSSWSALGSGMNSTVRALLVSGSDLYVGGEFTTAGGIAANGIAKWNGSRWSALGSGVGGELPIVWTLAVSGSDLYVGGDFTTAGGNAATNIAKWNGSSWSALGSGMNSTVHALALLGSDLYAGGEFTTAGGIAANGIAKWNGSSWSALGSGMSGGLGGGGRVFALVVSGSDLYVGGTFATAGGLAANGIVKWNGSSWSALGSGMSDDLGLVGRVFALVVSGSDLYAGGFFSTAGGIAATNIAKWNGSSWSALGSGVGEWARPVIALAVSGSDLYAGGHFTMAGGIPVNNIAQWNGSSWSALGSGMAGGPYPPVNALVASGNDLYAGGGFTIAGGKASGYIARAYLLPLPELAVLRSGTDVTVSWPSADSAGFTLEQAGGLAGPASWVPIGSLVTDNGVNKSVTLPATNRAQYFRLGRP